MMELSIYFNSIKGVLKNAVFIPLNFRNFSGNIMYMVKIVITNQKKL